MNKLSSNFIIKLLLLLLLLLCSYSNSQMLIDIDNNHPNLVISDMSYKNYSLQVTIAYDQSSTKAALEICLYIEKFYNIQLDDFAECVDEVGQKVYYYYYQHY